MSHGEPPDYDHEDDPEFVDFVAWAQAVIQDGPPDEEAQAESAR